MQAIVDSSLYFRHVSVGYPGSIHDARVLQLPDISDLAENGQICNLPKKVICGKEIGPLILGDSAYPLRRWLLKPYQDRGNMTPQQCKFNQKLSAARSVVERAFGMLKCRRRILNKNVEQKTESLSKTVVVVCVLHNICIGQRDLLDGTENDIRDEDESELEDISCLNNANEIRDAIKQFGEWTKH